MGEVKFEGLTVFKEERIRPLFKLEPGDVYKESQHQEGLRQAARHLRRQGYFQWTALHRRARPTPSGRSWTSPWSWRRTSGTTSGRITLHRQRHHARQGDPARGLPERGRRLQHRGPQALDPAHQPARLLQAHGGRAASSQPERRSARTSSTSPSRSRSRTATSSPSAAACSGLEGTFVNASLLDRQLPGPGRDLPDLRPERAPHQELPDRGHRALPLRPAHHRRLRPLQAEARLRDLRRTWSGYTAGRRGASAWSSACPLGAVHARLRQLLVRDHQHRGPRRACSGDRPRRTRTPTSPSSTRSSSARRAGGARAGSRPSLVHNTVDNPYTPRSGMKLHADPRS